MELLIIFIVMMVISSILRSFRSTGRTFTPPAPQPEIPVPSELFNLPEVSVEEASPVEKDVLEWPEYGQKVPGREASKQEKYDHAFDLEEARRQASLPKKSVPASACAFREEEHNMGKHFHELLSGESLPLGIIAMEIFSAPRARRPFSMKMR
jgi:hypothetical protein